MRSAWFAAVCLTATAAAQSRPGLTAEQIIEKSIEATGGRERLEKITSTVAKGSMEIGPQHVHSTVELYAKMPDRRLIVTNIDGFGEIRQGFDGQVAWTEDPTRGLRELEGAELADAKRQAAFNPELKWRELYPTIQLLGQEKVGDRNAFAVRLTPSSGDAVTYYYDAETFLIVRQAGTRVTEQGSVEVRVDLFDYREIDGIKAPFRVEQRMPGADVTITLSEIRNNVAIEDARFRKPAETQK